MNLIVSFLIALFFFTGAAAEVESNDRDLIKKKADRVYLPGDPVNVSRVVLPPEPRNEPRRDDWIGERTQVGDTWYDYQTNGSVGKMIAIDQSGGIHITWMDGYDQNMAAGERHQQYNYRDPESLEWNEEEGIQIDNGDRGGYGCMALTTEDVARPIPIYHTVIGGNVTSMIAIDFMAGVGAFDEFPLPRYPEQEVIWPQGVMSPEGRIHVVANRRDAGMISYSQGELDGEMNVDFPDWATEVQETHLNTFRIACSPNSERVAITWMRSRVANMDIHDPADWEGFLAIQINNDLMLAWTDDGENWNFDDPLNITDNIPPDPRQVGNASYGDTLRAYSNHDIIFDANDNIHVVFDARLLKVQAIPEDRPPIDGLSLDYSYLFHWSEEANEITPVADGWFTQIIYDDEGNGLFRPVPGAWRSNVCNPSLGYDKNGDLYCVYNYYPYEDYNRAETHCNGDVAVTVSDDNGATWYLPTMIVETNSLRAELGECECESYPTLAEVVDEFLHISYEVDTEPGTSIQNDDSPVTLCPWYYHEVPVDLVNRDELWEGEGVPRWHVEFRPIVNNVLRDPGVPVPDEEVQISTEVIATGGQEIDNVYVQYCINENGDEIEEIQMEEGVEDNVYVAAIPGQEEGTWVWYRILAFDNEDVETMRPEGWWYSYITRPEGCLFIRDIQYIPELPEDENWSTDYSPYKDYEVTVSGVVTTPMEFADVYGGYAIQEADTFWSGVIIRGIDDLQQGDYVEVTGVVKERDNDDSDKWRFQTYIDVSNVDVGGNEELPNPIIIEIEDMVYSTHAEHLEGVLVQLRRFELDTLYGDADPLSDLYLPITNAAFEPDEEHEGWMTFHGLDREILEDDLDIDTWTQGTAFGSLTGVFVENQRYAIAPRDLNDFGPISVHEKSIPIPYHSSLDPAFPNPFNAVTQVGFDVPITGYVHLGIYDLAGRLTMTAIEREVSAGHSFVTIDAAELATGVYILRLDTEHTSISQKLVLIK